MSMIRSPRPVAGAMGVSFVLALALADAPRPVCAQDPALPAAPIEIVLDASAAMRVKAGDIERMALARDFVRALRADLAGPAGPPALGLRIYGGGAQRAQRDCRDSRLALSATDASADPASAIGALQPQGVAPLAFALEQALADTARTYVLVTSGIAECPGDPCATWRDHVARSTNRAARLYVVALAPSAEDLQRLRCLSRAGSGSLTVLPDAAAVGPAAARLALVLKNQGLLDVRLSMGGEPLAAPVRLLAPRTREVVAAFSGRGPRPVPAGLYTLVVETSPAIRMERVMVLPGATVTIERSDFGRLAVDVRDEANRAVRAPVTVRTPRGASEVRFGFAGETLVLGAGTYDLSIDLGDSVAVRRGVVVTPGRTARVVIGGVGTVRVVSPEFPDTTSTVAILSRGGRSDTMRVGESALLPVGRYRLRVETIPVYVSDDILVAFEETTVVELPPVGVLRVELVTADGRMTGVPARVREPLTGETYGLIPSGERRLVMPGSFRLELPVVPPQQVSEVIVHPGQETLVERRGLSRIVVAPAAAGGGPYRLEVLSAPGGRRFGEATGAAPSVVAAPGTYHARVLDRSRVVWEGRVVVAPDRAARIDLARS